MDCSLASLGPITPETLGIAAGLVRLHEYGILTLNSRPYHSEITYGKGIVWYRASPLAEEPLHDERILTEAYSQCHHYPKRSNEGDGSSEKGGIMVLPTLHGGGHEHTPDFQASLPLGEHPVTE
ncbi:hypothetical protein P154DRAFT_577807 [Amniculicola lignicola CBS 123094]|uniref:Uncharacterized protein n=1 Tax=Amniculicola lignicola CBS 123094 TaxID=1392246 RepID=A0A6A5W966_9PLEO|nr:hypothetical protein P154DRAFT_577807 [Amniculicola lignicola CBS 123094]